MEDKLKKINLKLEQCRRVLEKTENENFILSNVFDSMLEGIVIIDPKSKALYGNKSAVKIMGYKSVKEATGVYSLNHFIGDSKKEAIKDIANVLSGKKGFLNDYKIKSKDGKLKWIQALGKKIKYQGKAAILVVIRDITESKILESKLIDSEKKYKALVEESPVSIFYADLTGKLIYINNAAEKFTGYSKKQLLNKPINKLPIIKNNFQAKAIVDVIKKLKRGDKIITKELEFVDKDNNKKNVLVTTRFIEIKGEKVIIGIVEDISTIISAQNEISKSKDLYKSILNNANDGISLLSPEGIVLEVNDKLVKDSGYSREELIGKPFTKFSKSFPPKTIAKMIKTGTLVRAGKIIPPFEITTFDKKGKKVIVEAHISALNIKGKLIGIITILRDVTQRKDFERKLFESKEKLDAILNNAQDAIMIFDKKGRIVEVSQKILEKGGFKKEDLLGKDFIKLGSLFPNFDIKNLISLSAPIFRGKTVKPVVIKVKDLKGKEYFTEISISPLKNKNEFNGLFVIMRDVTESVEFQKKLEKNEELFRVITENANDYISIHDYKGKYIYASPSVEKLGYKPSDLIGKYPFKFIDKESRNKILDKLKEYTPRKINKLLKSGREKVVEDLEYIFKKKNGQKENHQAYVKLLPVKKGEPMRFLIVARDVTKEKEITEKLKESKQQLKDILINISEGVLITDLLGNTLFANKASYDLGGVPYTPNKKINALDYVSKKDRFRVLTDMSKFKKGKVVGSRYRMVKANGTEFWVEGSGTFVTYEGRKALLTIVRDVDKQVKAEEKIIASEEKFRSIFNSVNDGIILINKQGVFEAANSKFYEVSGFKNEEIEGKSLRAISKLIPKETYPIIMKNFALRFAGKKVAPYEIKLFDSNRNEIIVEINATTLKEKGKIVGDLAVLRDITERKQRELKIKESEEKYSNLFNSAKDIFIYTDVKGNIKDINNAVSILGFDKDKLIGNNLKDFLRKSYLPIFLKNISKILRGKSIENVTNIKTSKGDKDILFKATPIKKDGKIIGILTVLNDITEKLKAERGIKNMFELSGALLCIADINGYFKKLSPAWTEFLGYSEKELLSKPFSYYIHPDDRKKTEQIIQNKLRKNKEVANFENRYRCKNGNYKYLGWVSHPVLKEDSVYAVAFDLSEQKKAEEKLKQSEEKLKNIFENTTEGILIINLKGKVLFVNPAAEKMVDIERGKGVGLSVIKFIAPEDRKIISKEAIAIFKKGESKILNFKVINKKTGKNIWVEGKGKNIEFEGQKAVLAVVRNIQERKLYEQKIKDSEKKYRYLYENSLDIYITVSKTGKIIDLNPAAAKSLKKLNYKVEEVINNNISKFVDKKIFPVVLKDIINEFSGKETDSLIIPIIGKNKKTIYLETSAGSIPIYKDNKIIGVQISARDATKRIVAEKELEESEEKYRSFIENSPVGVYHLDLKGRFVYANKKAEEISGWKFEEAKGKSFVDLKMLKGIEITNAFNILKQLALNKKIYPKEYILYRKDGSPRNVLVSTILVKISGKRAILGIAEDITERKKAQIEIKKSEEKYRALSEQAPYGIYYNDFKGKFLYGNKKAEEIIGFSRNELIGKSFLKLELLDASGLKKAAAILAKNISGQETEGDELELNTPKGKKNIFVRTKLITVEGKKVVMGIVEDITEKKFLTGKLAQTEENYKTIFNSTEDAIFLQDAETGKVIETNNKVKEMFGYDPDKQDITMGLLSSGNPPYTQENGLKYVKKAVYEGLINFEWEVKKQNGTIFWVEITLKKIVINKKTCVLAVVKNIQEKKEADRILEEHYHEQEIINNIIKVATRSQTLEDFYKNTLNTVLREYEFEMASIYLIDQIRGIANLQQTINVPKEIASNISVININKEPYKNLLEKQKPWLEENYKKTKTARNNFLKGDTVINIPLSSESKAIGVISIAKSGKTEINDNNLKILEIIGREVGILLSKLLAEEKIEERTTELERFNKISVGRELKMIELKKKIEELENKLRKYEN